MVLSKRERMIAVVTLLVMLVFILDRYVATPFMDAQENIRIEKQGLINEMQHAAKVFRQRSRVKAEWQEMLKGGLESDSSVMESRVLNVLGDWSRECGISISSIKPDRSRNESNSLMEIIFNVACRGSMDSVGRFMWQIENSKLPLRITEFQLGSREEDGRDMALQLKLSAVYLFHEVTGETANVGKVLKEEPDL
ncbi:hypothetical protein JXL19_00320 [bacterium]|nr:hypothetical protein [bacterium]